MQLDAWHAAMWIADTVTFTLHKKSHAAVQSDGKEWHLCIGGIACL
jgi:hypothetical protein